MKSSIIEILNTIFKQDSKKIVFLFVIFILTGASYLSMLYYKSIIEQNAKLSKQTYEAVQKLDPTNVYRRLYGINSIDFEKSIKTRLMEYRLITKSDLVLMFGLHNGQQIGTSFHARRMSLIAEDHAPYKNIDVLNINTFNVALFALTIDEVLKNNLYSHPIDSVNEQTMRSFMKSYNDYYVMAKPIRTSEKTPIAIVFSF